MLSSSLQAPLLDGNGDCDDGDFEDVERAESGAACDTCEKCLIFFEYGVVVILGLESSESQEIIDHIARPSALEPLDKRFCEREELDMCYCNDREAKIRNDTITLPRRLRRHQATRLAIAHALAQSTKLCVFEEQGLDLVRSTKHLPRELASRGEVSLSRIELSKLIGKLFMQRSEIDLLSSALDTPEYFWQAPDTVQELYKKVCEYLEMDERIEAVNKRLEVSHNMLDMLQNQHDVSHGVRLEWIVIILVAIEGVVGFLEFFADISLIPQYAEWRWWFFP